MNPTHRLRFPCLVLALFAAAHSPAPAQPVFSDVSIGVKVGVNAGERETVFAESGLQVDQQTATLHDLSVTVSESVTDLGDSAQASSTINASWTGLFSGLITFAQHVNIGTFNATGHYAQAQFTAGSPNVSYGYVTPYGSFTYRFMAPEDMTFTVAWSLAEETIVDAEHLPTAPGYLNLVLLNPLADALVGPSVNVQDAGSGTHTWSIAAGQTVDFVMENYYGSDGGLLTQSWSNTGTVNFSSSLSTIPEPSACAMLAGLGAVGLALWRRRRAGRVPVARLAATQVAIAGAKK